MGDWWRSIETAPKDGRWFLAWRPDDGGFAPPSPYEFVHWDEMNGAFEDDCRDTRNDLTHWMPLPESPNSGAKPGEKIPIGE